jgi:hypothetical protein
MAFQTPAPSFRGISLVASVPFEPGVPSAYSMQPTNANSACPASIAAQPRFARTPVVKPPLARTQVTNGSESNDRTEGKRTMKKTNAQPVSRKRLRSVVGQMKRKRCRAAFVGAVSFAKRSIMAGVLIAFSEIAFSQPNPPPPPPVTTVTVGAPVVNKGQFGSGNNRTTKGIVTVQVFVPGVQPQPLNYPDATSIVGDPKSGVQQSVIPVMIPPVIDKTPITTMQKANVIVNAINKVYGSNVAAGVVQNANGTVSFTLRGGTTLRVTSDNTGEPQITVAAAVLPAPTPTVAAFLNWGNGLGGVDAFGDVSEFTASIGFDGLTDTANLFYDQLAVPTLDDLVTEMFSQLDAGLPVSLQPELSLDLSDDQIVFVVPQGSTALLVNNFTTDIGVELDGGVSPIPTPEPSSVVLLCIILLCLVGMLHRKVAMSSGQVWTMHSTAARLSADISHLASGPVSQFRKNHDSDVERIEHPDCVADREEFPRHFNEPLLLLLQLLPALRNIKTPDSAKGRPGTT